MTQFHIRRATPADRDALVAFNADVLRYQDAAEPDHLVAGWTQDLLNGRHPHVGPADFCVVADTGSGRIVSSLCLISQTWSYGGIAFAAGQPELVGTHPDYRGRGLVRRQFEMLHEWSAARGQHVQAIDGIPGFYHQFGYGMALALRDELSIAVAAASPLTAGHAEPYRVRAARAADVAFIDDTEERARDRYLVAARRDQALWRYELEGRNAMNQWRVAIAVVEAGDGSPVGFLVYVPRLLDAAVSLIVYELIPTVSWEAVTPSVLRHLRTIGESYAAAQATPCERIGLCLGSEHPAYAAIQHLAPRDEGAYAWQLRVPDLPGFLRHVAPVLEGRLAQSALAGLTGQLHLSFYHDGVRLVFARGRLVESTSWRPPLGLRGIEKGVPSTAERADASFPGPTFLQLLFGFRSLEELQYAFPDCLVRTPSARPLLQALFPQQPSNVWPVL